MEMQAVNDLKIRKHLFVCGIFAAVLFVSMILLVGTLWKGYSSASQTVSERSAIDAPTRPLWMALGAVYTLLITAFGWGIWRSAPRNNVLRIVGALIMAHGLVAITWPPMHQRAVLAASGPTLTDSLHIVWTIVDSVLMLFAVAFSAAAFGRRFRIYSIATIAIIAVCGAMTGPDASRIQANLPTPLVGVWERFLITAFMLWLAVLGARLLRGRATNSATRCRSRSASSGSAPIAA